MDAGRSCIDVLYSVDATKRLPAPIQQKAPKAKATFERRRETPPPDSPANDISSPHFVGYPPPLQVPSVKSRAPQSSRPNGPRIRSEVLSPQVSRQAPSLQTKDSPPLPPSAEECHSREAVIHAANPTNSRVLSLQGRPPAISDPRNRREPEGEK